MSSGGKGRTAGPLREQLHQGVGCQEGSLPTDDVLLLLPGSPMQRSYAGIECSLVEDGTGGGGGGRIHAKIDAVTRGGPYETEAIIPSIYTRNENQVLNRF